MKASRKKWLIVSLCLVLCLCLAGTAIVYLVKNSGKPVRVAPASAMNNGYWEDSADISSYGNVTSGLTQEVPYDETLSITEIYVKEGDTVRIGDPLVAYDTSLLALELEMKQMQIDGIGLNIQNIQAELDQLKNTAPVAFVSPNREAGLRLALTPVSQETEPESSEVPESSTDPGETEPPTDPGLPEGEVWREITADSVPYAGSGTAADPYRFYVFPPEGKTSVSIGAGYLKKALAEKTWAVFETVDDPQSPARIVSTWTMDWETIASLAQAASGTSLPEEARGAAVFRSVITGQDTPYMGDGSAQNPYRYLCASGSSADFSLMAAAMETGTVYRFDVVDDPDSPSCILYSWTLDGRAPEDPGEDIPGGELPGEDLPGGDFPGIDIPAGPTKEELETQIREKEDTLKTLDLEKRTAALELKQLQKKIEDGVVKSTVNGTVRSVLDEETARLESSPLITVGGEDGFYITGYVAETALTKIEPGMTLTATSWNTGMSYEATVTGVGTSPSSGYSSGNPNLSYYPFTAVIQDDADLTNGDGVDLSGMEGIESGGNEGGLYLPAAFVREDGSRYYVYKKGENGRLTKQYVETGKIVYGTIEILSGLAMDEEIAFPYGRDVKEGARTQSVETLYDYGY